MFLIWSSSLITFFSVANKLYHLRAICKHFVHVLQLLTWQGRISDPTLKSKKGCENTQHTPALSMHTFQTSSFRKNQPEVFSAAFSSLYQKRKSACRFFPFGSYLYLLLLPNAFYFAHALLVFFPSENIQKAWRGLAAIVAIFWGRENKKVQLF